MITNKLHPVDHYFPNAAVLYYDIIGSTAEELRAQMDVRGPVDSHGCRWDAINSMGLPLELAWLWGFLGLAG
jgi:predicted secreted Zn-dependent protease